MRTFASKVLIFCGLFFFTKLGTAQPNIEIIGTSIPPYDRSVGVNSDFGNGGKITSKRYLIKYETKKILLWKISW